LIRIEGDAIFLYANRDEDDQVWEEVSKGLVAKVMAFLRVFSQKLAELMIHKFCNCTACINIEALKLKIVVHSGRAAFYRIDGHQELTGTSPIVIHRLMKNSVEADEYVLITESAYNDLSFADFPLVRGEETYDDIGTIKTYVYYPPEAEPYVSSPDSKLPTIFVETLREEVCKEYAEVALNPELGFHFHTGRILATKLDYSDDWLEGLPEEAIESFAGTGNPFCSGILSPGQKILDAGCGAGLDCLIAAKMVGSAGEVIGVDMTKEMIEKASAQSAGVKNVTFKKGVIEELPVEDQWADMVISNGALNLAPDKDAVFRELNRVLKLGGGIQVADILVEKPIPESARRNIELWTG
jgi:2-polyprenyl-3-methyl-5-hydroxy-6-metoxy-1,4-benzoquinol methylase